MAAKELSELLRARMAKLKICNADVARRANLSRQTWYNLLNAEIKEAKLSTLVGLANALEIHTLTLLQTYFQGQRTLSHTSTLCASAPDTATGFIADTTYPDNSIVRVGEEFEKVWEIANLGKTPWIGWRLVCVDEHLDVRDKSGTGQYIRQDSAQDGLMPLFDSIPIPDTLPGGHVQLGVWFRAPDYPCSVISYWKSVNAQGELAFPHLTGLYCKVKVISL